MRCALFHFGSRTSAPCVAVKRGGALIPEVNRIIVTASRSIGVTRAVGCFPKLRAVNADFRFRRILSPAPDAAGAGGVPELRPWPDMNVFLADVQSERQSEVRRSNRRQGEGRGIETSLKAPKNFIGLARFRGSACRDFPSLYPHNLGRAALIRFERSGVLGAVITVAEILLRSNKRQVTLQQPENGSGCFLRSNSRLARHLVAADAIRRSEHDFAPRLNTFGRRPSRESGLTFEKPKSPRMARFTICFRFCARGLTGLIRGPAATEATMKLLALLVVGALVVGGIYHTEVSRYIAGLSGSASSSGTSVAGSIQQMGNSQNALLGQVGSALDR